MFEIHSEFYFPKQFIISDDIEYYTYKDRLVDFCYKQQSINPKGMQYSNVGGWQSDANIFHTGNEEKYNFFTERLQKNINECFTNHFLIIDEYEPFIDRMWVNISKLNDYNTNHTHPMSHFTGIFYVKCDDDSGNLHVSGYRHANDSQELNFRKSEIIHNHGMYQFVNFTPKEGRLLLFPACLSHSVYMNKSNCDRISIAFDILFQPKILKGD